MKAIFFPKDQLDIEVCAIYNGHQAIVSHNTDRLVDNESKLAEINLFKYNIQGTSFLNPYGSNRYFKTDNENTNYGENLKKINNTGRISFGLYHRTGSWKNPTTNSIEYIPNYYDAIWGQDAIDAGFNVVIGDAKSTRYPNHGQNLYDISNGAYGYDFTNQVYGSSGGSESNGLIQDFLDYFKEIADLKISAISYRNGQNQGNVLLIPYVLFGRNSNRSDSGDSLIDYSVSDRSSLINRDSSTRTWDAQRDSTFPSKQASIDYSVGEIQKAIDSGGWYSDFMHWHSLYNFSDLSFFEEYYSAIRTQIGSQDVWMAGNDQAAEYYFIKNSLKKKGSYEHDGKLFFFYHIKDAYLDTFTLGISNASDLSLFNTPISFKINTTGTALANKDIKCDNAESIRKISNNIFVINVPYRFDDNGYASFVVEQTTSPKYYSSSLPTVTLVNNSIYTNELCNIVIWSMSTDAPLSSLKEVYRSEKPISTYPFIFLQGIRYFVGAINKFKKSSILEINP